MPPRFAPILFGLVLSGLMSLIVSGIATLRAVWPEADAGFLATWMGSWLFSWGVAFPTVLVVGPLTRRLVARVTRDEGAPARRR